MEPGYLWQILGSNDPTLDQLHCRLMLEMVFLRHSSYWCSNRLQLTARTRSRVRTSDRLWHQSWSPQSEANMYVCDHMSSVDSCGGLKLSSGDGISFPFQCTWELSMGHGWCKGCVSTNSLYVVISFSHLTLAAWPDASSNVRWHSETCMCAWSEF